MIMLVVKIANLVLNIPTSLLVKWFYSHVSYLNLKNKIVAECITCQLTGLFKVIFLASGVFEGIQKLGRCLSLPSVIFDTDGFSAFFGSEKKTVFSEFNHTLNL